MIELVIKIPGEIRKLIFDGVYCGIADKRVFDAIKNGVSLPKGHGRLIDADKLNIPPEEMVARMAVQYAPTVIKADTESEEEEWLKK